MLVLLIQRTVEQSRSISRGGSPAANERHAEEEGEIAAAASAIASPIEGHFLHTAHACLANSECSGTGQ